MLKEESMSWSSWDEFIRNYRCEILERMKVAMTPELKSAYFIIFVFLLKYDFKLKKRCKNGLEYSLIPCTLLFICILPHLLLNRSPPPHFRSPSSLRSIFFNTNNCELKRCYLLPIYQNMVVERHKITAIIPLI